MLLEIWEIFESRLTGVYLKNFRGDKEYAKRKKDLVKFDKKLSEGNSLTPAQVQKLVTRILYLMSFSEAPGYPKSEMAKLIGELSDRGIEVGNAIHARGFDSRDIKYAGLSACTQAN